MEETKERAAHQRLISGIGRHDVQRETFEDFTIRTASQPLNDIALDGDPVGVADDPLERAKLHGRERILDRSDRLITLEMAPNARPESVARGRRCRKWLAFQLTGAAIARCGVVMQSVEIRIENGSGDVAQQIVCIVLQHSLQCIPFKENSALEIAEADARRGGGMADQRAWLVNHSMTSQPRSPSEIDILEVGEVVVIEAAEGQKGLAARDHVAAAGEEELAAALRLPSRSNGISKTILECVPVEGHHTANEVDQLSAHVDDFSADGDHVCGSIIDGAHERREPARLRNSVVVDEDHVARLRTGDARGDASRETVVLSQRKKSRLREPLDDCADAPIGRSVVDNRDRRAVNVAQLGRDGLQASDRVIAAVPVDDDDVDGDQDAPPMRRLRRSRMDAGRSGTCMRTAKASLFASVLG